MKKGETAVCLDCARVCKGDGAHDRCLTVILVDTSSIVLDARERVVDCQAVTRR